MIGNPFNASWKFVKVYSKTSMNYIVWLFIFLELFNNN